MSVSFETLDKLKKQLKEIKDLGMPIRADLYSHLTEVFNRIMLHHPEDGYEKFEEISALVKQTNFKIKDPANDFEVNQAAGVVSNKEMMDMLEKWKNLLNEYPDLVPVVDQKKYISKEVKCAVPNFPEQADMFEWAGIGFGSDMSYVIQKSIKRLAMMSGATSIRFFGKILCQTQDYWVAQGTLNRQEQNPLNVNQELRGTGVNEAVFWVTTNMMNDWIQLPDCQPEMISGAKLIKKSLTGNLNAPVDSTPPFPFQERHLLRAQLARIQHATQIVPNKTYELDEETNQIKFGEEAPDTSTEALKSLENWCHYPPYILNQGRCTHVEPDIADEEARNAAIEEMKTADPPVDRFKALNEDKQLDGMDNWTTKLVGDSQQYNKVGGEGTVTYAINVISSTRWPGAVTVAKGGQFATIYIGDGIKRGDSYFNPTEPPEVQTEPKENPEGEQPEPQGKDPPPEGAAEGEGEGEGEGGE